MDHGESNQQITDDIAERVNVARLEELARRVQQDLDLINHPKMQWLEPRVGPDGQPALDVLIVGAGQSGVATAFGLIRSKVDNILVIDKR